MFFMPYIQRLTHSGFPIAVALIVFINTFVYISFQSDDQKKLQKALDYYTSSILPSIELPLYKDYLSKRSDKKPFKTIQQLLKKKQIRQVVLHMQKDYTFIQMLHSGELISKDASNYVNWYAARARFELLFNKSVTLKFSFKTNHPSLITAFTHQFLHGSYDHLLGNMLVLILIGPAVEALIGKWRFIFSYLVSGLGAVGFFYLSNRLNGVSLVGASGAIAGVMGAFTVLFGMKRIPFFYFVIVYFNVVRAPALLALPIWIAHEAWQWWHSKAPVAYEAHIGGLITGALISCLWYRLAQNKLTPDSNQQPGFKTTSSNTAPTLQAARQLMAAQRFDEAQRMYASIALSTNNEKILTEAWNIVRLSPLRPEYLALARHILLQPLSNHDKYILICQVFSHLKDSQNLQYVEASVLFKLAKGFLTQHNTQALEQALKLLLITAQPESHHIEFAKQAVEYLNNSGETLRGKALSRLIP